MEIPYLMQTVLGLNVSACHRLHNRRHWLYNENNTSVGAAVINRESKKLPSFYFLYTFCPKKENRVQSSRLLACLCKEKKKKKKKNRTKE